MKKIGAARGHLRTAARRNLQPKFSNSQKRNLLGLQDCWKRFQTLLRKLMSAIASHAVTHDEYRHLAEGVLRDSFDDNDTQVRSQAAHVFQNIKPEEFQLHRTLAERYINSKAFETESFAFFHALQKAECRVDDIVISAAEKLIADLDANGNQGGRRSTDLHQLQNIIKSEYASSENEPDLRHRLLNLIDKMLSFELYGTDEIIRAHER